MNHEERQAQLLDAYLDALKNNPNAIIPDGLDPEMADFARMFMSEEVSGETYSYREAQVWENIQKTIEDNSSHNEKIKYQEINPHMRKRYEKQKRSGTQNGWIPLAAVAIFTVLIGGGLIGLYFKSSDRILDEEIITDFSLTATQLVMDATATHMPTQNAIEQQATQLVMTMLPTATPIPTQFNQSRPTALAQDFTVTATPIIQSGNTNSRLVCDFERDLLLRLNRNELGIADELVVTGMARDSRARKLSIEIFGGFLTDDTYVPIVDFDNPATVETELARISGSDYSPGSYLLQLRLSDSSGETLSSCALPVTFSGN